MEDDKFIMRLDNGMRLYQNSFTLSLQEYAKEKGIDDCRIFLAVDSNGYKEFLMVIKDQPEFASQRFEDVAVHIDIMWMRSL